MNIFDIDEILRTFLQFCEKPTLARLARTNKLFSDPALDALWETLESFSHLLKIFPPELISWHASDSTPPKPTVNHLIVPRDWKRFAMYAQRVRTWSPEDLSYIEEPVVDHIAFGRNPDFILPRLTHIEVTASTVSGVHLQTLILCPTLESVTIWNQTPNVWSTRAMNTFFRTLSDRAPNLRKLTVHWGDGVAVTAPFVDGLSDMFSSKVSVLNSVNLWSPNCIDAKSFCLLSQLPCLTTLHLNLINMEDASTICSDVKDHASTFPALQNLFLAGNIEQFYKMLRFFGTARVMVSLGFSVREYPTSKHLLQLLGSVATNFPGLRIFQFNVPKEEIRTQEVNRLYHLNSEQYHLDLTTLQPLLTMRNLAAVHLELGVPLYLSDTDMCVIGSAWPAIEVLNLCSDPYCERARAVRPAATVQGLLAVATACPALQHLGLFLDCSIGISEDALSSVNIVSRALINLDVGRSWVVEPPLVAALLSGVFPALKVFQWAGMDSPDSWTSNSAAGLQFAHSPGWRQVFDLLPVFHAVRRNERRALSAKGDEVRMFVD
ncbi:hypothetical protein DFH11DRAFT_1511091 [Phellopilus nigrolimitatus]|nr:hypothetical protein DFH11DRAFT_1511091 [Phellopilus nigrolimitatus]